jgi:hypothetical protein
MGRGELGVDMYIDFRVGMAYCCYVDDCRTPDFEMWYQDWSIQVYKWVRHASNDDRHSHIKINLICYAT